MEIFADGGLFELVIIAGIGYAINFIFLRKYLLYIFSALTFASPVSLIFISRGELYYLCVSLCVFNSIFLIILLWRQRARFPKEDLFDIAALKRRFLKKRR